MKITYRTLLTMVNANEQPKKIKVGTATYTWNGCDYILNTDSRKSLSDTLTSWTTKAQTTAEFIEVVQEVLTDEEKAYLSAVIKPYHDPLNVLTEVREKVRALPTVEAEPVRHGKWISNSPVTMRCNKCTYVASDWIVHEFHYCPNCGAKMDERKEE